MKCRHCLVEFHDEWSYSGLGEDRDGQFIVSYTICPSCKRLNAAYERQHCMPIFFYPRSVAREPLDPSVPEDFSGAYVEACDVLNISPKASAALSRRCLQHILRDCAKVKPGSLDNEIQQILGTKTLPSHIADSLDAIRTVGNFAAHPLKGTSSGEVLDVESGEAEWNLDTVEALLDFYFVQPAKTAAKRDSLNKKLADAGKPPLK
jgi:hypothetical protein